MKKFILLYILFFTVNVTFSQSIKEEIIGSWVVDSTYYSKNETTDVEEPMKNRCVETFYSDGSYQMVHYVNDTIDYFQLGNYKLRNFSRKIKLQLKYFGCTDTILPDVRRRVSMIPLYINRNKQSNKYQYSRRVITIPIKKGLIIHNRWLGKKIVRYVHKEKPEKNINTANYKKWN